MKRAVIIILTITAVLFQSCKEEELPQFIIDNPADYTFERDGISTVSFSGQTDRIKMAQELIDAMNDFSEDEIHLAELFSNTDTDGNDVDPYFDADLNASSKSVRAKVAASKDYYSDNVTESAQIKSDFDGWISAQVNEIYPVEFTLASPGIAGQIADGSSVRYVNAKGLEYNQAVNKSLIGALMVDQICNNYLSTSVLDDGSNIADNDNGVLAEDKAYTNMEHKWDEAYGYIFGTATNTADPVLTIGEDDSFLNKYLGRVNSDDDFAGISTEVFESFKLGRAAIVAGDYQTRNEEADKLRKAISKVIGIRAVYYLQAGKNALPDSGNNYGTAFHDLSEGYGFIYSLRFTRNPDTGAPYVSASESDGYIGQLMTGNGFWEVTPETLDNISESIAAKFDFTVEQAQ